jgi:putative transposase
MPRTKRLDLAGVARHVVQRGNDRQPCFFRDGDYRYYLQTLQEACTKYRCRVHAYVLMTNHVHLLMTPEEPDSISKVMQALGSRYVRYVNDTLGRSGTLWEGRYKASLVDTERYVMACYRYIELNPVRAGMLSEAGDYLWSSYPCNGQGRIDPLVSPHHVYLRTAADPAGRQLYHREFVAQAIPCEELETIRVYIQRQRALGSTRFQEQIERQLGRRAGPGVPGRPRKERGAAEKVI